MTGTQTSREDRMKSKAGPMKRKVLYAEEATGGPGTSPAENPFRCLPVMAIQVSTSDGLVARVRAHEEALLWYHPHPYPENSPSPPPLPLELSPDPELEKLPMSCGFDTLPLIITDSSNGVSCL